MIYSIKLFLIYLIFLSHNVKVLLQRTIKNKFISSSLCDIIYHMRYAIILQRLLGEDMQTVYIDIFFLINFSMDFLSLFLASRLLSRKVKILRLALSALLGGFYACFSLVFSFSAHLGVFSLAVDALACLLMAFIAIFSRKNLRGVFSFALVFGAVSILLGGAMTALFALFNRMGLDSLLHGNSADTDDGISVWLFAVFALISAFLTLVGGKFLRRKSLRQEGMVEIAYRGKSVSLPCVCDSGNLLREPISRLPCIVVDPDAVAGIFSSNLIRAAKSGDFLCLDGYDSAKIRLIPTATATGETMLLGMRVDSVSLDMGKGACEVSAYIAFSREPIVAKGVKALVPSELCLGTA